MIESSGGTSKGPVRVDLRTLRGTVTTGVIAAAGLLSCGSAGCPLPIEDSASVKFIPYASFSLDDDVTCTVGATIDEDGMSQRPRVRLADGGIARWTKDIAFPLEYHAGRATHCLVHGGSLYVLVQMDAQSQKSLSQTVLRIVRLKYADGAGDGQRDLEVPGVSGAYSAWVPEDTGAFYRSGDVLVVVGRYRSLNKDDVQAFAMTVEPEMP